MKTVTVNFNPHNGTMSVVVNGRSYAMSRPVDTTNRQSITDALAAAVNVIHGNLNHRHSNAHMD